MPTYVGKSPDEVVPLAFDLEDELGSDGIDSVDWTLDAGLSEDAASVSGYVCTAKVSGGTHKSRYNAKCLVTTTAGYKYEAVFVVSVFNRTRSNIRGNYCALADIENVFGMANVHRWSNLDNVDDDLDANRIVAALAYADDYIDNAFRQSQFVVPLVGVSGTLTAITDLAARLAGLWLYESRGADDVDEETGRPLHRFSWHWSHIKSRIRDYLSGRMRLNAQREHSDAPEAPFVVG